MVGRRPKGGNVQVHSDGTRSPQPCQPLCAPQQLLVRAYPGPHGNTGQISRHLSHIQESHEGSRFSVTRGRGRLADASEAAGPETWIAEETSGCELEARYGRRWGHTCAAAAIANSSGSKFPSLSFSCSTWEVFPSLSPRPSPYKDPIHFPPAPFQAPSLRFPSSPPQTLSPAQLFILTCSSTPVMMSRGSSTFPRDLLIFRPCLSRTME